MSASQAGGAEQPDHGSVQAPDKPPEEAIVLAGGLGTRLRSVVSDVPKPLAPISGRPFLEYLLTKLAREGVRRVILSVGYKYELIEAHFGARWGGLDLVYEVEEEPLGTGGALVASARRLVSDTHVFALNGDTILNEDFSRLAQACRRTDARFGLFVRRIEDTGRYSTCVTDGEALTAFAPGSPGQAGLINAGVYCLKPGFLTGIEHAAPFGFEDAVLPSAAAEGGLCAVITEAPFLDIGVPDSFALAQEFIPALAIDRETETPSS